LSDSTLAIRQLRSAGIDISGKRLLSHPDVYWESFGQLFDSASDPELASAAVAATRWYMADDYLNAVANAGDPTGQLLLAADSCSLALVELLAERGADMNARDQDGATALAIAERCPDSAIAEFLIRDGATPGAERAR
jgi:ankyrin repeat protein